MPYDSTIYPHALDFFREVSDGNNPENKVTADLVNKVQNAILAVENHTQYTVTCPNPTGCAVLARYFSVTLASDQPSPGLNYPIALGFSPIQIAAFCPIDGSSRNPFSRQYCVFSFAQAYKIVGGVRSYFQVHSAVNVGAELNNAIMTVDVIKTSRWRAGDTIDVCVLLARS
jgi:hypothetical protein